MSKEGNNTLYILKFRDLPLIKIGISKVLGVRINKFRKEYQQEFDLQNSYAIGCHSTSKIKALEYELTSNSEEFKITGELRAQFDGLDGATEIRDNKCLPLLLKLIKYKAKLTGEFHIHSSISLEKNPKIKLPIKIFNEFGETPYQQINVSSILIDAIKKNVEQFKSLDEEEITNLIINDFVKKNKVSIENERTGYKRKKMMRFANYWKHSNWYWTNPNSKLKDIKE